MTSKPNRPDLPADQPGDPVPVEPQPAPPDDDDAVLVVTQPAHVTTTVTEDEPTIDRRND